MTTSASTTGELIELEERQPDDQNLTTEAAYEERHVHSVYGSIASHFSQTRYKPWPIVHSFLLDLPRGALGLDVGCGNGKYFGINPSVIIVASDR